MALLSHREPDPPDRLGSLWLPSAASSPSAFTEAPCACVTCGAAFVRLAFVADIYPPLRYYKCAAGHATSVTIGPADSHAPAGRLFVDAWPEV